MNEILIPSSVIGANAYALLLQRSSVHIWNGTTFEIINPSNLDNYIINITDQGLGIYTGTRPSLSDGQYEAIAKLRIGSLPVADDPIMGQQSFDLIDNVDINFSDIQVSSGGLTSDEIKQLRSALGIDGDKIEANGGQLQQIRDVIVGPGTILTTLTITKSDNTPVEGAEVWVSTDIAGDNVVAGIQRTDIFGKVGFMLNIGTYYRWARKSGIQFSNPKIFSVS